MAPMYTELSLDALPEVPDYRSTTDAGGRTERILTGLGRVNLFVGRNNSGKSRLLRAIYKAETLHFATAELPRGHIRAIVEPVRRALEAGFDRARTVGSYGQVSRDFLDPVTPDDLLDGSKISNQLTELRDRLTTLTHDPRKFSSHGGKPGMAGYVDQNEIAAIHNSVWPLAANALELLKAINISPAEPRFYIPVLRGLRPLSGSTDPYAARTQGDYGLPAPDQHRTIFTGLGLYAALDTLVRGSPEQRAGKSEYEAFLSAQFFQGERIDLTPRIGSDVVHVRIGSGSDFPVYNLGDGLQSMIGLTFAAFTAEASTLFLVEEPEQHLHPGMQRRVLELYARAPRLARHQYFITTHSNHLLDMAIDDPTWSTFVFRREAEVTSIAQMAGGTKLVLHELGARASSVFLTNASIWVEGVTDRLYLRAYLRKYFASTEERSQIREDTHYSFIEYGGANITHFDFGEGDEFAAGIRVAAVCSASFVVADGDIEKRAKRLAVLRKSLGDRLFVLKCKEVENLLPANIVQAVVVRRGLDPTQASKISEADYQQPEVGLGKYLDDALGGDSFAAPSGTVKQKVAFCDDAVREMNETEWNLTLQARQLCDALVSFVRGAQGR